MLLEHELLTDFNIDVEYPLERCAQVMAVRRLDGGSSLDDADSELESGTVSVRYLF